MRGEIRDSLTNRKSLQGLFCVRVKLKMIHVTTKPAPVADVASPGDNVVFLLNDNKCHEKDDGYCVFDPHSRMSLCLDVRSQTAS